MGVRTERVSGISTEGPSDEVGIATDPSNPKRSATFVEVRDFSRDGLLLIYPLQAIRCQRGHQSWASPQVFRLPTTIHRSSTVVNSVYWQEEMESLNLAEVWRHLEEDTRITDAPGRVQRRILPAGRRRLLSWAWRLPPGIRMLVLRVAASSVEGLPDVPDSRGLNLRLVSREAGSDEVEVVLALSESQHRDIFDLLVRDLVGAAEQPHDEREGLVRFLARLSDWQQLLRRLGPRGLTREAQQGLWGELWALREVVAPVAGMSGAVDGWRGPMGTDQDFQAGGHMR